MRRKMHLSSIVASALALLFGLGCIRETPPAPRLVWVQEVCAPCPDPCGAACFPQPQPEPDYSVSLIPEPTDNPPAPEVVEKKSPRAMPTARPTPTPAAEPVMPEAEVYFAPNEIIEPVTALPTSGGESLPILMATPAAQDEPMKVGGAVIIAPTATPTPTPTPTPALATPTPSPEALQVPGSMVRPTPFTPPVMNSGETTYQ